MRKFCNNCAKFVDVLTDPIRLSLSCASCGRILKFDNLTESTTFEKGSDGVSKISGRIVNSIENENISRQRLYDRAFDDMVCMKNGLDMGDNLGIVQEAMVYYRIAVERNFTKGRRTEQVQAACLYLACRENRKPYLLIDFSNYLKINIYALGAVFLQLCKVLNLVEHPIVQRLLDPSIFIHKYTAGLTGGKNKDISDAALNIIASMNRDWMQTGRRPSGLWGAALYISALSHGLNCSKSDILKLVHVCEATLSKRLVEFEMTESGSLTIEELNEKAEEFKESSTDHSDLVSMAASSKDLLCHHKGSSRTPYAHGLCNECYAFFIGFDGGSDPPAFQRAEKQRKENSSATHKLNDSHSFEKELNSQHVDRCEKLQFPDPEIGEAARHMPADASENGKLHDDDDTSSKALDESDNFSDIDDAEVDGYLHNEEEAQYKKIIWEEMNREYLEEQAAKEAVAAAAKEAWEAKFKNCPEDMQAAKKLEAAVAEALAKSKKERQQKRAAEARNSGPAQTATEAAHQMLTKKRISSKINYDVLEKLFDEPGSKDPKKQRTESHSDEDDKISHMDDKNDDLGPENGNEDGEDAEAYDYNNDAYDEDVDEAYGYDYDDDGGGD